MNFLRFDNCIINFDNVTNIVQETETSVKVYFTVSNSTGQYYKIIDNCSINDIWEKLNVWNE